MPEKTQAQKNKEAQKMLLLEKSPVLGIFDELRELHDLLKEVISSVNSSVPTNITIDNPEDIRTELNIPEVNFEPITASLQQVLTSIKEINSPDLQGIEKLLKKISEVEQKDIDLSELTNISNILNTIFSGFQNFVDTQDPEKLEPELKTIQKILNVLNENVVSLDIPEFDYSRLARVIKENINIKVASGGSHKAVNLETGSGDIVDVQTPLPTDGDSIYSKDVNTAISDMNNFTGSITDLFDDLQSNIVDSTANDPKEITLKLNRPINNDSLKFCTDTGNFSNVKILLEDASGTVLQTIDDSSNNTKYTSNTYDYPLTPWCTAVIQFHTTDTITLGYAILEKSQDVHAINRVRKPDGTYVDATGTTAGNPKVAIEEYDDSVNPVRKDLEGVGDLTVGVSEVEVVITGTPTCQIRIRADVDNTGIIFIGKTGVLSDGSNDFVRLESGDEVVMSYNDADNPLYAISDTALQSINIGALI